MFLEKVFVYYSVYIYLNLEPMPLFSFVWQYNNQPIESLASDILDIITNGNTAPVNSPDYIPVSNGLTFENSWLINTDQFNNPGLRTEFTSNSLEGIELNSTNRRYTLGNFDQAAASGLGYMTVNQDLVYGSYATLGLTGGHSIGVGVGPLGEVIQLNGTQAFTAGAPLGQYLEILVNGTPCKIELLNM